MRSFRIYFLLSAFVQAFPFLIATCHILQLSYPFLQPGNCLYQLSDFIVLPGYNGRERQQNTPNEQDPPGEKSIHIPLDSYQCIEKHEHLRVNH